MGKVQKADEFKRDNTVVSSYTFVPAVYPNWTTSVNNVTYFPEQTSL